MTTQAPAVPRRTRLTPERELELYTAVIDLLREVGYEALTMDAVAASSRSSKATLYRQWKGKPELVAAALRAFKPAHAEDVDTGSITTDLHALACALKEHEDPDTALMRALAHATATNPDLSRALREALIEPEIAALDRMIQRAVDRGEIAADRPAIKYALYPFIGAFLGRPLIEDLPVDAKFLCRYIDAVILPAFGVAPAAH